MFLFLSKLLPLFLYPVGFVCIVLVFTLWRQKRGESSQVWLLLGLLVLWLSSTRPVALGLMRSLEWQYLPPEGIPEAEVIVVLGGMTRAADAPRPLVEVSEAADRLLYGAWLYHEGYGEQLLLTGGRLPWSIRPTTEAEEMAFLMEMLGVPQTAVLLEDQARNTYENGVYSGEILAEIGADEVILVTSAYHMPRAVAVFEAQGVAVVPAPTDFVVTEAAWEATWTLSLAAVGFNMLPTVENLMITTQVMKEYVGLAVYRWRGWA